MVALRKIDIIEESDSSLGAANDNVPFPPHHRNIRMSAVSHGGLYVQNGRSRNIWGEMTQARQFGGGADKSQYYYYNPQRRLCRHRTPEGGDSLYFYDAAGQMGAYYKGQNTSSCVPPVSNTDKVSQSYDAMGRPKQTTFHDGVTPDILNVYNANGQMTLTLRDSRPGPGVYSTDPRRYYDYNELDLLLYEDQLVDGIFYPVDYEYNDDGHRTEIRYPTGRTVRLNPDGLGRLTRAHKETGAFGVQEYVRNGQYHPSGALKQFDYGNGLTLNRTLDARLLTQRQHITGGGAIMDLSYYYDQNARVTQHNDALNPVETRHYTYDGAGRLKTATGPWGGGNGQGPTNVMASYSYDGLGNLLAKSMDQRTVSLTYNANNRLTDTDDVGSWNGVNTGLRNFTYDTRGNVTGVDTMSFAYDLTDQPVTAGGTRNGNTIIDTYVYDGNLKRVKIISDDKTIYNVFGADGRLIHVDQYQNDVRTRTDYIQSPPAFAGAGSGMAARVKRIGQGPGSTESVTYLHNDHLGSASIATDDGGAELWTESFTPFGEALIGDPANDNQPGFTGHIKDKATGLNYMQTRYYDPVGARFLSVDPVTFMDTSDPRMFNKYAYTFNDPINLTDPDGQCPYCLQTHYAKKAGSFAKQHPVQAGVIVAGAAIVVFDVATIPSGEGALGAGMINTALATAGKDALVGAGTGMTIDVAIQMGENGGDLSNIDIKQTLIAGAEGAVSGMPGGAAGRQGNKLGQKVVDMDNVDIGTDTFAKAVDKVGNEATKRAGTLGATGAGVISAASQSRERTACQGDGENDC